MLVKFESFWGLFLHCPYAHMSIIYYKNLIFPSIVRAFWKIPTKKSVQIGQISRLPGNPISLML